MTGSEQTARRSKDGGVYLVVAEETDEFRVALRYAARSAQANHAYLGILRIITIDEFQHWANVEERMRRELRREAETYVWQVAKEVHELTGIRPALYIGEGDIGDMLVETLANDHSIRKLVLGGSTSSSGPGPLVTYFAGRGLSRLRVPLTIVPGNMSDAQTDSIVM